MIDHCISTFQKNQKDLIYRVYVTNALKNLIEIQTAGWEENIEYPRFYDLINKKPNEQQDEQEEAAETADDVIKRIKSNLINIGV